MKKRQFHCSAQKKLQVALEAVKEVKTINQVTSDHGLHLNQIIRGAPAKQLFHPHDLGVMLPGLYDL